MLSKLLAIWISPELFPVHQFVFRMQLSPCSIPSSGDPLLSFFSFPLSCGLCVGPPARYLKPHLPLVSPVIGCQPRLFNQSEKIGEQSLRKIFGVCENVLVRTATRSWRPGFSVRIHSSTRPTPAKQPTKQPTNRQQQQQQRQQQNSSSSNNGG